MVATIKRPGITGYVDCSGLFSKGHTIERWHAITIREVHDLARAYAPVSDGSDPRRIPGNLQRSIRSTSPVRTGSHYLEGSIRATAPYARFVHEGTTGPITPKNGRFLTVPAGSVRGGQAGWYAFRLSGGRSRLRTATQKSPWLLRGPKARVGSALTPFILVPDVRGQDSQPFLADAIATVAAHRGWRPGRGRMEGWDL